MRKNRIFNWIMAAAIILTALFGAVEVVSAQNPQPPAPPANFPYPVKLVSAELEKGETVARQQWALAGFDPAEYGGDDSDCSNSTEDDVKWVDEIGAPDEDCKIIFEWSLKNADETLASGVMPLEPEEENVGQIAQWIRFSFEQSTGRVRFTGSMWREPQGWNAHQQAVNFAADWQQKNPGEWSVVGLSPTDAWVQQIWQDAETQFDGPPVPPPPPAGDNDGDGVNDADDRCLGTPAGQPVDADGCPVVTPPPGPGWWQRFVAWLGNIWNSIQTSVSGLGWLMACLAPIVTLVLLFLIGRWLWRQIFRPVPVPPPPPAPVPPAPAAGGMPGWLATLLALILPAAWIQWLRNHWPAPGPAAPPAPVRPRRSCFGVLLRLWISTVIWGLGCFVALLLLAAGPWWSLIAIVVVIGLTYLIWR